jgi:hypothetical protein
MWISDEGDEGTEILILAQLCIVFDLRFYASVMRVMRVVRGLTLLRAIEIFFNESYTHNGTFALITLIM